MKKGQRREHFAIIAGILESAVDGVIKTKIMYAVNLSYAQLGNYVSLLVRLKLLEKSARGKHIIYKTTEKGVDFLKRYEELKRVLNQR